MFVRLREIIAVVLLMAGVCAPRALAQATHVDGTVTDKSGAVIRDAHVKLQAGSYSVQTTTDSAGAFAFESVPATTGTVEASANGFRKEQMAWTASASGSAHIIVSLAVAVNNQQVIVTASRTATPIGESPVSDIQLSADDLQATPALTLDDTLRQVPGFSLFRRTSSRTANPTTLGVSLRGLGANGASRALVLEDGVPLNDPFGSWVYWDRVPDVAVASVEVAQEGASSLYGSEALGGVVQFLTRPAEPGGVTVEASYGNQNTQDVSLAASGAIGKWEAVASGEAFHTDGYVLVPPEDQGAVDTSAFSQHGTGDLTVARKFGTDSVVFARGWYFNDTRNNGTIGQSDSIRLGEGALGANLDLGEFGNLQLRSYAEFETYKQSFFSVVLNQSSQRLTDLQTVPAQGIGGSALWTKTVGKRQTLVAGYDDHMELGHSNEQIFTLVAGNNTNSKDTATGGHQRTMGVFGEDIIQLAPGWTLELSARFDDWRNYDAFLFTQPIVPPNVPTTVNYTARSYNAFSPRASIVNAINSHFSWSASAYRAFRAPTLNELYRSFRQANNLTDANPNLRAEELTGGEAGVAWRGLGDHLQLRSSVFINAIAEPVSSVNCQVVPVPAICPAPTANTNTFVRANLGKTFAPGFEVDWLARITDRFQISGGYQFVDSTIISAPLQPQLVNTWVAQVPHNEFTWQARYTNPSLISFTAEGRFVGRQLDTNQIPMGNFFVLDAMVSRDMGHGVQVFSAVENLFNEEYVSTAATTLSPEQRGLPIAGRVGVRLDFPAKR
jgi:outer membrane receptor protein involved in Fe transport